jgi:hypothetical protein
MKIKKEKKIQRLTECKQLSEKNNHAYVFVIAAAGELVSAENCFQLCFPWQCIGILAILGTRALLVAYNVFGYYHNFYRNCMLTYLIF